MVTEEITVSEHKFVILHINETTKLVHRVNVRTPNDLIKESTHHYPMGITREEAIK